MKVITIISLLIALALVAYYDMIHGVNSQRELTDATFKSALAEPGAKFVKFYAPWCGHCKRLAPTWEQLASKYAGNSKVEVVKVDCTKEKNTCNEKGIRGYPTLILFKDGSSEGEKYQGARDIDALSKWVDEKI